MWCLLHRKWQEKKVPLQYLDSRSNTSRQGKLGKYFFPRYKRKTFKWKWTQIRRSKVLCSEWPNLRKPSTETSEGWTNWLVWNIFKMWLGLCHPEKTRNHLAWNDWSVYHMPLVHRYSMTSSFMTLTRSIEILCLEVFTPSVL